MNRNKEITVMLAKLGFVFTDKPFDDNTLAMYHAALADADIEQLKTACLIYLRTGRKFPLPVDLLELCGPGSSESDPSGHAT